MLTHQEERLPIFVYGTLMIGERNYIEILHDHLTHYEETTTKGKLYYYHASLKAKPSPTQGHRRKVYRLKNQSKRYK